MSSSNEARPRHRGPTEPAPRWRGVLVVAAMWGVLCSASPALAETRVILSIGGARDVGLVRQPRLEVGPARRMRLGVGFEPQRNRETELRFFVEYGFVETTFASATTGAPPPRRRHDLGAGFAALRDRGRLAGGLEWTSYARRAADGSLTLGWELGPTVEVKLAPHLTLSTTVALSLNPMNVFASRRVDPVALRFGAFASAWF